MANWSNWARNVNADVRTIAQPTSGEDIVRLVEQARQAGTKLRPVGAGHSFSPIAQPVDTQVKLTHLSGIEVDSTTKRVRIKAGTHLYDLVEQLQRHNLALPNMGDIDRQTISGAVSTSTHGTGANWTGFGGAVVGGELVTGTGETITWRRGDEHTEGQNEDMVDALGVTLGALGILTEVEMQCVDSFGLHAVEQPSTLTAELASLDETLSDVDHYEFFWFPHTDKVMTKRNTRLTDGQEHAPLGKWKKRWEDDFLSNTVYGWLNELGHRRPTLVRHMNRVSASALSAREFSDVSHRVYASPRLVRFRESELAVPLESAAPILRELQAWVEKNNFPVTFPVEVRWTAADNVWMSTAYERPSCYIAIHQFHKADPTPYFQYFWDIAREHQGRPHWGKEHNCDAEYLRTVYPKFDAFCELRERFDPERIFTNPYLDTVLGA